MTAERGRRPTRGDFAMFQPIETRWSDNDAYGHVNNVVFYSYFDTAVNRALIGAGLLDIGASATICYVAETRCAFHAPASFPQALDVGVAVSRLGRTSVRYALGVFAAGENAASASGNFVHVFVDRATQRPVDIPADYRAFLERLRR